MSLNPSLQPALWKGRRVLLTGHTGFKGTWLAAWLHQLEAEVMGYSLPPDPVTHRLFLESGLEKRMVSHYGDIRDYEGLRRRAAEFKPELILHLAAQALVRLSYSEPLDTYATNVMGTAHVLELARYLDSVGAVVVVTTDKCYDNQEWAWPYRENDRLGGHDPYSNSKACAELVTDAYRRSFLGSAGKLVASARAGNVVGGGDWALDRLVPDAIRAFAAGESLQVRSPGATRPWQHVVDPLHGYLMLAQRLLQRESDFATAFNFGPPDEHTVGQVVDRLVAGWPGASYTVPPGEHPHEAARLHLDSSKARQLLGWRPMRDFEATLEHTLGFYRRWHLGETAEALLRSELESFSSSGVPG